MQTRFRNLVQRGTTGWGRRLSGAAIATCLLSATAAHAQIYVNTTVGGQFAPGVYGQVTFGNAPPPPVINPQPVIIAPVVQGAPVVYLHVPDYEQRDWRHYCYRYGACDRPVHFVLVDERDRWWEGRGGEGEWHRDHGEGRRGEGRWGEHRDEHRGEHRWEDR